MNQTLSKLLQGDRFKPRPARSAFLVILLGPALGLLVWTAADPHTRLADAQADGAARGDLPRDQVAAGSGSLDEILAHPDVIPTHDHPLLGRQAPDFELTDVEGKVWNSKELLGGRPVVLIFYYGYHCVSCVRQLAEVNRDMPLFREVGARVVAISADPPELTRQRFEQYGPFDFPVLSDPENKIAHAYRAFRPVQEGRTADTVRHGTFVIDRDGAVQWVNVGDAPFRRNSALLYQLAKVERGFTSVRRGP